MAAANVASTRLKACGYAARAGIVIEVVGLAKSRSLKNGRTKKGPPIAAAPTTFAQSPVRCPAVSSPLTMTV